MLYDLRDIRFLKGYPDIHTASRRRSNLALRIDHLVFHLVRDFGLVLLELFEQSIPDLSRRQ